jgi:hypothetical protein
MQHIGTLFRTRFYGTQFIVISLKEGHECERTFPHTITRLDSRNRTNWAVQQPLYYRDERKRRRARRVEKQWLLVGRLWVA